MGDNIDSPSLRLILRDLWATAQGKATLLAAAGRILDRVEHYRAYDISALMGSDDWDCWTCTGSEDSRGRVRLSLRYINGNGDQRKNQFAPWHIVWLCMNDRNLTIPLDLQYSHRCHTTNCVNPRHGVWETDLQNKSRNSCRTASHLIVRDAAGGLCVYTLCPHNPCCLRPGVQNASQAAALPLPG
jgi:hypothetical protein